MAIDDLAAGLCVRQSILALGYEVKHGGGELRDWQFGTCADEDGGTYEPRPFPTEDITVDPDIMRLGEMLAENSHDVWQSVGARWVAGLPHVSVVIVTPVRVARCSCGRSHGSAKAGGTAKSVTTCASCTQGLCRTTTSATR